MARALPLELNMNSSFRIRLSVMPEGVPARIAALDAAPADVERLEVMGLCSGRIVEVVQAGDPLIVRVLGTRIGLASVLARSIEVENEYGG
jgi:Fe2+ transport system protein FeoA